MSNTLDKNISSVGIEDAPDKSYNEQLYVSGQYKSCIDLIKRLLTETKKKPNKSTAPLFKFSEVSNYIFFCI
jgi:hypothetical protein